MSTVRCALAIACRPWLWRSALRFVPKRWWTYPPFLPLPPKEYVRFRMETMYGDPNHRPDPTDLVTFLRWARTFNRR